jgi:sulfocyanin
MNRWGFFLLWLGNLWSLPGQAQTAPSSRLSYDSATKTLTFDLEAEAPGAAGPFGFNGSANGAATFVVPAGCIAVINFVNLDGTPRSAELVADTDPLPSVGGDPAIVGAYTKDVTQALLQGGKDVMRFTAPPSGSFRIICGVPGHGLSSMWIHFKVDPAANLPRWVSS